MTAKQRAARYVTLRDLLTDTGKSGMIRPEVIIVEMVKLVGLNPKRVMIGGK